MAEENFSYSKLSTYKDCPFRFYLNYVLKNFAYSASIATEFGSAIHKCEEDIAHYIQDKKEIDYVKIKNEFIVKNAELQAKYPVDYFADDGKSGRNYQQKAYEYLDSGIYRLEAFMKAHPTYEIVGIEQRFNFKFDESHNFNGAIDRVFHDTETDEYLIQDIKSWAVPAESKDLATPLQFVFYVLAAKDLWGADPEKIKCQYDLPLCNMTQDGGTKGFMIRGVNKINSLFEKINEEDYHPNPTPLCHWCAFCRTNNDAKEEFKLLCPYCLGWTRENKTFKKEHEWLGLKKHSEILESYKSHHKAN